MHHAVVCGLSKATGYGSYRLMYASICNKRLVAVIIWCYGLIVIGKEKISALKVLKFVLLLSFPMLKLT